MAEKSTAGNILLAVLVILWYQSYADLSDSATVTVLEFLSAAAGTGIVGTWHMLAYDGLAYWLLLAFAGVL